MNQDFVEITVHNELEADMIRHQLELDGYVVMVRSGSYDGQPYWIIVALKQK